MFVLVLFHQMTKKQSSKTAQGDREEPQRYFDSRNREECLEMNKLVWSSTELHSSKVIIFFMRI